jgi:hypothetical protein
VVERLTKNVNEDHLREIFGQYGEIEDLDLPVNRSSESWRYPLAVSHLTGFVCSWNQSWHGLHTLCARGRRRSRHRQYARGASRWCCYQCFDCPTAKEALSPSARCSPWSTRSTRSSYRASSYLRRFPACASHRRHEPVRASVRHIPTALRDAIAIAIAGTGSRRATQIPLEVSILFVSVSEP